jgi:ubiquinone/menaquinone biosynthesis C-methylase UbiE
MTIKELLKRLLPARLRRVPWTLLGRLALLQEGSNKLRAHLDDTFQQLGSAQKFLIRTRHEISEERQDIRNLQQALEQLGKNLECLQGQLQYLTRARQDLTDALLAQRTALLPPWEGSPVMDSPTATVCQANNKDDAFGAGLDLLRRRFPHAFSQWYPLLTVNKDAYEGLPTDSCSVTGHAAATSFGHFVRPYLRGGRVLDIGCGPQSVPVYLAGYPSQLIAGIDPLEPAAPHPFEFVRGFAEHLPWPDRTFEVVIAATSLDHVLSLDVTFDEIRRVLAPGGVFLTWVWFSPGAELYDPTSQHVRPIDRFHLFHFAEGWFEELVGRHFTTTEKVAYNQGSHFYSLAPRAMALRQAA